MTLSLPACGQVCVGDVCFGYPDETGGDEEDPPSEMWCFNRAAPIGSRGLWCLDDDSLLNKIAVAHYLMAEQVAPDEPWLGWSDDYCGEVLLEVDCFGGVLSGPEPHLEADSGRVLSSVTCKLCWPFENDDPVAWHPLDVEGPIGLPETVLDDGRVWRALPSDWLDSEALQPSWGYGATAICGGLLSDGSTRRVRCSGLDGCECPCSTDADCPQNFGEGICEFGECFYSNVFEPPPYPAEGVVSRYACCNKSAGGYWGCFPWREEHLGDCGKWPTHGVFWAYIDCEAWVGPGSKAGMCSGFTDLQPDLCCSAP